VLQACAQQLHMLGPQQLGMVAVGLGKLVGSSNRLAAAPLGAATTTPCRDAETAAAAAAALRALCGSAAVVRLQQRHVARVASVLPLLAAQHRRQLAAGYGLLGATLPRAVAQVLARDAAAAAA
jgi:hypothetical protein